MGFPPQGGMEGKGNSGAGEETARTANVEEEVRGLKLAGGARWVSDEMSRMFLVGFVLAVAWCGGPESLPLALSPTGDAEFVVELSDTLRRGAGKGRLSALREAHAWLAVPPDFEPARGGRIFVVSATGDPGLNSSRAFARKYREAVTAAGWIVLAADPVPVVIPEINEVRYATVRAALGRLAEAWPGAERWPVAFGGFSGGSKYSGYLAAMSAREGRMPAGIFLAGCNAATPAIARLQYNAPRAFRDVPVFLSSGDDDPVSTPDDHRQVRLALTNDGFRAVRLETYPGKHVVHAPHARTALEWFDAARAQGR